ncbi:MAG: 3-phosphoshikimate 1-carboxyvinyltransferase [Spirosomataceae bacterium]
MEVQLPSSKSESNRALIIDALTDFRSELSNLSEARDTRTMMRLLLSTEYVADVIDAGTTMRFMTAYFAVTGQHKVMTGTPRMCERPIGSLVDALRSLGANIDYLQVQGYPPLRLSGFSYSGNNQISIKGGVSSQYISALLMIAPMLPEGIVIQLEGEVGSKPYIEMTLQQMAYFGINYEADWKNNRLVVPNQSYQIKQYSIESDWSGASYWYSAVAMAPEGSEVELLGLKENSLQGDSVVVDIMKHLGVTSRFTERGVKLTKTKAAESLTWDFTNCPDLAQTISVCCAAMNIPLTLTGIESLKIKETDRVKALQTELIKFGVELAEVVPNERYELKGTFAPPPQNGIVIDTYDDHRMAMAFAPLSMLVDIKIDNADVVVKSYPRFWEDMGKVVGIKEI